jgi:SNF2 family DNA or RNA helicase
MGDLFSLLRFLRVHPYNNSKVFESEILRPWKTKADETALKKVQCLVRIVALRRSRTVITLPHRQELTTYIHLTADERSIYDQARITAVKFIESALESDRFQGSAYMSALQRINVLRYICNNGILPPRENKHHLTPNISTSESRRIHVSEEEMDVLINDPSQACVHCGTDIEEEDDNMQQALQTQGSDSSECMLQLCSRCLGELTVSASATPTPSPQSETFEDCHPSALPERASCKIQALIGYLKEVPTGEKW